MCSWQILLLLSKHGLFSSHYIERKAEIHLLNLHVSLGFHDTCLFAIQCFKFYVTCDYAVLVLQKEKKQKVDTHRTHKEKCFQLQSGRSKPDENDT